MHTSVVAAKGDQTQNGEETATVRWWPDLLDTGYLVRRSRYRQRVTRDGRGTMGGRTNTSTVVCGQPMKTRERSHATVNSCADTTRNNTRHHHQPSEGQRADRRVGVPRRNQDAEVISTSGAGHASGRMAEAGTQELIHDRCRY